MRFIDGWLKGSLRPPGRFLTIEDVEVSGTLEEKAVQESLGHELRRNYVQPGELAVILDGLGAGRLADHLRANILPSKKIIRHGDFGEAVSGAMFRQMKRYCVPIMKLRYKQGPNQPLHLADLLAFRLRYDPPIVAVLEVKTRSTRSASIGEVAYTQLGDTIRLGLGPAITFIVKRLIDRNPTLATRVARVLDSHRVVERHVVLIHDDAAWRETIVTRMQRLADQPTNVVVVRVPDLAQVVDSAYAAALNGLDRDS